jgi:hypothetical protein
MYVSYQIDRLAGRMEYVPFIHYFVEFIAE